jgi:hypothetical protein
LFDFLSRRFPCRDHSNYANIFALFQKGVNGSQKFARPVLPQGYPSILIGAVILIINRNGKRIQEYLACLLKPYPVLFPILLSRIGDVRAESALH